MRRIELTIDEIIAVVKRSRLPTVLCEGKGDLYFLRQVESRFGSIKVNFLPCGGRMNVLSAHDRRSEIQHENVAFLADLDMWLLSEIPARYEDVIFTIGYSIENDCIDWDKVEDLMSEQERDKYLITLNQIVDWFASEHARYCQGLPYVVSLHVSQIFDIASLTILTTASARIAQSTAETRMVNSIRRNYRQALRGKTLLDLCLQLLNKPGRASKYSRENLFEISLKLGQTLGAQRLVEEILSRLR